MHVYPLTPYRHGVRCNLHPSHHPSRDFLLSTLSAYPLQDTPGGVSMYIYEYNFEELTLDIIFLNQLWVPQRPRGPLPNTSWPAPATPGPGYGAGG